MTWRHCLTLDLQDDPALIAEYKRYHEKVWPEIIESIKDAGIQNMELYLRGTRLFMIMEGDAAFSFEKKAEADRNNPRVQEWENLMWTFQKPLAEASPGEKWMPMERIFQLDASLPQPGRSPNSVASVDARTDAPTPAPVSRQSPS